VAASSKYKNDEIYGYVCEEDKWLDVASILTLASLRDGPQTGKQYKYQAFKEQFKQISFKDFPLFI